MIHIAIFSMGSAIDGNHPRIGKLNGGAPFCAKSDQQLITGFTLIEVKSFDSGCLTEQSAGVVQVHDGEKRRNTEEEIENTLVDFTVPRTNRAKKGFEYQPITSRDGRPASTTQTPYPPRAVTFPKSNQAPSDSD